MPVIAPPAAKTRGRSLLELPPELRMCEVCCVGLSTVGLLPLHNPTPRWLHAHLTISTLTVDGQDVDPQRHLPFVMKEKVVIEPSSTENIKVCIDTMLGTTR